MIPVKQDRLYAEDGIGNGNCLAACLASLLELPLWMIPPFDQMFGRSDWRARVDEYLGRVHGMQLIQTDGHELAALPEFYIACGMSAREVMHAVVYSHGELVHDPHWSNGGIVAVEYTRHLVRNEP